MENDEYSPAALQTDYSQLELISGVLEDDSRRYDRELTSLREVELL